MTALPHRFGGLAVDVIHDDEVATVFIAADLVDRCDVLMMERTDQAGFVEEHRDELIFVVRDVERLHDDVALEATEPGRFRQVHLPHARLMRGDRALRTCQFVRRRASTAHSR